YFGGEASPVLISRTGEFIWGLLCSHKSVVIIFQFGLIWLTASAEKLIIWGQKPISIFNKLSCHGASLGTAECNEEEKCVYLAICC
ncbi:hypothetical protein ACQP3J_32625, partial [Escherichia coli]